MAIRNFGKLWQLLVMTFALFVAAGCAEKLPPNPLTTASLTADPAARVFDDHIYVYCTHDLPKATYWNTHDWVAVSSSDLTHWKYDGPIFDLKGFSWAHQFAWAPDCVAKGGHYFLILPVDRTKIGVAVGDHPQGPYKDAIGGPLIDNATNPAAGEEPIDPAVLIDDDGTVYLYFGCRSPKIVKLDPSLRKLAGQIEDVQLVDESGQACRTASGAQPRLPQGYGEAPFVFKRGAKYYFVYSNGWWPKSTLVYAVGDAPTGPFRFVGEVMKHAPSVTQHGSIVEFHGRWFVFYHTQDISNGNTFQRCVCVEEIHFAPDGKIVPAIPRPAPPGRFVGLALFK